ncbi:MAG TPA: ester cyclase [Anaerolineales bacterium]|nr:ester cyclase [Anaerolineales bacterium]
MLSETNKTVSRRFYNEVWNNGDLAVLDEIITKEHVNNGPGTFPGLPNGPEGSKQLVTAYRNAFPDVHFTIDDEIAEGDKVVTRWTAHGTHQGELAGIPATGKSSTVTGITVNRFVDGKVAESWGIFDQFGMMQQLGVIPTPELAGK